MRGLRLMVLPLLVALFAISLVGCSGSAPDEVPTSNQAAHAAQTPEDVIRQFFLALGRHDYPAMEGLMSTYLLGEDRSWVWADIEASASFDMSNLRVSATLQQDQAGLARLPDRYRQYHGVIIGTAEYVLLTDTMCSSAGPQIRFVTVVKETATSPWRVEEIGTGP